MKFNISTVLVALISALPAWGDPTPEPVGSEFTVNTIAAGNQDTPDIAVDANGSFVVVWESYFGEYSTQDDVQAQRFDSAGNPLGGEFKVNTVTARDQDNPAVAVDANGNFVVVWESFFGEYSTQDDIQAQRFDSAGNPLGSEFKVNTVTAGYQEYPAVAIDANGNFVVVYSAQGDVQAQRFDSAGNPLGSEFKVNTVTASNQDNPAVAVDANGNFVVVWESYFGEYSGRNEVQAQRFTTEPVQVPSLSALGVALLISLLAATALAATAPLGVLEFAARIRRSN